MNSKTDSEALSSFPLFLIGGTDISRFRIVYEAEPTGHLREFAERLRDAIAGACGAVLLVCDSDIPSVAHEILIGNTRRPETEAFRRRWGDGLLRYSLGMQDGKYVILGGGIFSVMKAVEQFIERYLSGTGQRVRIPADEVITRSDDTGSVPHTAGSELRVMTHNIMAVRHAKTWFGTNNLPTGEKRVEVIQAVLRAYTPDVVGYQEACPSWRQALAAHLDPAVWGIYDPGQADGSNGETVFVYNRQRVAFLEGAPVAYPAYAYTSRIVWGRFALVAKPQKQFLLFTTHWAGSAWIPDNDMARCANMEKDAMADLIRRMRAENGGIAAFTTGDYNTYYQADRYRSFEELSGLTDSFDLARKAGTAVNRCGGCSCRGGDRSITPLDKAIDHIFCPPQTKVLRYETVTGYRVNELSDHSPRYADLVWES